MKKISKISIILFSILLSAALCFGESTAISHKIEVEDMTFGWEVNGEMIKINLTAKTAGWVGIGFNPSDEMKDANFIIGYVKNGKASVSDHYGTSKRQHQEDKKLGGEENITDITGKEENNTTEIGFTIPLNSGDSKDREIYKDKENIVLLAHGSGRDSFRARHQFKAVLKLDLLTGKFTKIK